MWKHILAYESYDFNTGSAADIFNFGKLNIWSHWLIGHEIICETLADFFSYQCVD